MSNEEISLEADRARAALHRKLTRAARSLSKQAESLHWKAETLARLAANLSKEAPPRSRAFLAASLEGVEEGTHSSYDVVLACVQSAAPNIKVGPKSVLSKIPVKGVDVAPCINKNVPLKGKQKWYGSEIDDHPTWTVRDLANLTDALKQQQP